MKLTGRKSAMQVAMLVVMVVIMAAALSACDLFGDDGGGAVDEPTEYTIQYTDSTGVRQITVKAGEPYSISPIPSKTGYEFTGLYDAEHGGTQYVNAQGSSVGVFTDNRNMVLFPQFKAKTYTIMLDYGGAEQSGVGSMEIIYGAALTSFPDNLRLDNKVFEGWFTRPDCGGIKIADSNGRILNDLMFTEQTFDVSTSYVKVYAGYSWQVYDVQFNYPNEQPIIVSVEHGTALNDVQLPERVDGKKVTQWREEGGNVPFDGVITRAIRLTPAKWSWTVSESRTTQMTITEEGYNKGKNKNKYDKVIISDMFGRDVAALAGNINSDVGSGGYRTASIKIVLSVREIDDGYQWIKICSTNAGKDTSTLFEQRFEHGPGKVDKNSYTHTFTFSVNISDLTNQINIYYDGQGDWDDDWVCESMKITITLNQ